MEKEKAQLAMMKAALQESLGKVRAAKLVMVTETFVSLKSTCGRFAGALTEIQSSNSVGFVNFELRSWFRYKHGPRVCNKSPLIFVYFV